MDKIGLLNVSWIEKFDCNPAKPDLGPTWMTWIDRMQDYLNAVGITDEGQKVSILFFLGGSDLKKIHQTLLDEPVTKTSEFDKAVERLSNFFSSKKNTLLNQLTFHKAVQHSNETITEYISRLRKLAEHCDFPNLEFQLTYKVVCTCTSEKLRRMYLQKENLTFSDVVKIGYLFENSF